LSVGAHNLMKNICVAEEAVRVDTASPKSKFGTTKVFTMESNVHLFNSTSSRESKRMQVKSPNRKKNRTTICNCSHDEHSVPDEYIISPKLRGLSHNQRSPVVDNFGRIGGVSRKGRGGGGSLPPGK